MTQVNVSFLYYGGTILVVTFLGLFIGYWGRKKIVEGKMASADDMAQKILKEAEAQVESKKREAVLEAKDKAYKARSEFEEEVRRRHKELENQERAFEQKEHQFSRKAEQTQQRERELTKKEGDIHQKETAAKEKGERYEAVLKEAQMKLEAISGLTVDAAKKQLFESLENEAKLDFSKRMKQMEDETKENALHHAQRVISIAIGRVAMDHTSESTVTVFPLPNEELKGRIIGREGRNIRALEAATGVDIVVDDTPEAILISGFDGVRREIARISLTRLIADGRIHPARVEEIVAKVKNEMEGTLKELGEKAMMEANVIGCHPEVLKMMGRLRFRTSYSQNVLHHSVEVAYLTGIMAGELGMDQAMFRRAGFLHDIGKAIDHEIEGTHPELGAEFAKRYNEPQRVLEAIRDHHGDDPQRALEAILVQAADAISGARPGARGDNKENYIKRIKKLEEVATSFPGVDRCYAIQAGREIRVMVAHEQLDDIKASQLSRDIAKKIETDLQYPGQIKVTVIRETRYSEYAK